MKRVLPLWGALLLAATAAAATPPQRVELGYLERSDDPAYHERRLALRYPAQPAGRPYAAAEVALHEARYALADLGIDLQLVREAVDSQDALIAAARKRLAAGPVAALIVDLEAPDLRALTAALNDVPVLLINVRSDDDDLRGAHCARPLLHAIPSARQRHDAISQWLTTRNWRKVLLLHGPQAEDQAALASVEASLRRFGLRPVATRAFKLSRDPREREQHHVGLLTAGPDHDVVWVIDRDGEFARGVPYATQRPRPVVGDAGLDARAWHWAWDRHGAPQLTRRLQRALGRDPVAQDWAAWMAVKSVVAAMTATRSTDAPALRKAFDAGDLVLDGFKGFRLGYRPWDGQLRQPLLLGGPDQVLAVAPLEGFLHPQNALDTLGADAAESRCPPGERP